MTLNITGRNMSHMRHTSARVGGRRPTAQVSTLNALVTRLTPGLRHVGVAAKVPSTGGAPSTGSSSVGIHNVVCWSVCYKIPSTSTSATGPSEPGLGDERSTDGGAVEGFQQSSFAVCTLFFIGWRCVVRPQVVCKWPCVVCY